MSRKEILSSEFKFPSFTKVKVTTKSSVHGVRCENVPTLHTVFAWCRCPTLLLHACHVSAGCLYPPWSHKLASVGLWDYVRTQSGARPCLLYVVRNESQSRKNSSRPIAPLSSTANWANLLTAASSNDKEYNEQQLAVPLLICCALFVWSDLRQWPCSCLKIRNQVFLWALVL